MYCVNDKRLILWSTIFWEQYFDPREVGSQTHIGENLLPPSFPPVFSLQEKLMWLSVLSWQISLPSTTNQWFLYQIDFHDVKEKKETFLQPGIISLSLIHHFRPVGIQGLIIGS